MFSMGFIVHTLFFSPKPFFLRSSTRSQILSVLKEGDIERETDLF